MFRSASPQIAKALPRSRILASRLSSLPDPRAFFIGQHNEEAQSHGEYIDIHGISKNLKDYDVLISDVDHEVLETAIAKELGIPYLSKATEANAQAIAPFVVCHEGEARWVFFIVDNGAPMTYLSSQTSQLLGIKKDYPNSVKIGGCSKDVYMSPPNSHFANINLLGGDSCATHSVFLAVDYKNSKLKLFFGGEQVFKCRELLWPE